mmetsp:Transcript_768/g.1198  ORF Transcript_768/g.1198 Transcript_768/m.1198 type:complete len:425 (+) Transcript_768:182-1456(+)|eukprot:CAMPEP_0195283248 /NCGR_PEP_ID=MMETSP0707-20130614/1855_1 /TAXON_ID=33640 /ORGANISM="Asterionellopsis glacialis, Strain CCMP134" /LENGTH=424 /DNA_ID=CAMNT_0040342381 /DNA_START=61 /DNA_END=1335 /DNA_ORIENTATION=-
MTIICNIARHGVSKSLKRTSLLRSRQLQSGPVRSKSASPAAAPVQPSAAKTASQTVTESTTSTTESSVPVAKSLAAALAGIVTVSGVAAAIEQSTAGDVPAFDPNSQRFDQSNFAGRFSRMLLACDPRLILYTEEQARAAAALVADYQNVQDGTIEMDRTLWEARRISESALHPDTGDLIPRPFRMSGYVPFNGPVAVAMVASSSTPLLLFWAWANQSQNALVNYFNRNAASTMTNETLAKSYAAAVGSALTVAFGLATFIQKRYPAAQAKQLLRYVAFPSSVAASSLNCYIVRSPEIDSGIPLINERGENVLEGETSQEAAKRGVHNTTASRAILQAPVYFLPPILLSTLAPLKSYLAKSPTMVVPITTYMLLVCFGVGLPGTVAIFPQICELKASEAEEKFQHLRDPHTNKPYEVYYYNKGL